MKTCTKMVHHVFIFLQQQKKKTLCSLQRCVSHLEQGDQHTINGHRFYFCLVVLLLFADAKFRFRQRCAKSIWDRRQYSCYEMGGHFCISRSSVTRYSLLLADIIFRCWLSSSYNLCRPVCWANDKKGWVWLVGSYVCFRGICIYIKVYAHITCTTALS